MHTASLLSGFHPLFMRAAKKIKIKQPLESQMGCFSTGDESEERHQLREPQLWHDFFFFFYIHDNPIHATFREGKIKLQEAHFDCLVFKIILIKAHRLK